MDNTTQTANTYKPNIDSNGKRHPMETTKRIKITTAPIEWAESFKAQMTGEASLDFYLELIGNPSGHDVWVYSDQADSEEELRDMVMSVMFDKMTEGNR